MKCKCGKEIWKTSTRCHSCARKLVVRHGWSAEQKENRKGSGNPMWKGDNVGYFALHSWARARLTKPKMCDRCRKNEAHDLANISGLYKRDLNDWEYLCRKCHMTEDGRMKNLKQFQEQQE